MTDEPLGFPRYQLFFSPIGMTTAVTATVEQNQQEAVESQSSIQRQHVQRGDSGCVTENKLSCVNHFQKFHRKVKKKVFKRFKK